MVCARLLGILGLAPAGESRQFVARMPVQKPPAGRCMLLPLMTISSLRVACPARRLLICLAMALSTARLLSAGNLRTGWPAGSFACEAHDPQPELGALHHDRFRHLSELLNLSLRLVHGSTKHRACLTQRLHVPQLQPAYDLLQHLCAVRLVPAGRPA